MQAAIPQYMCDVNQAAPGHRFGLYFPIWSEKWELEKDLKAKVAEGITLQEGDNQRLSGLLARQRGLAIGLGDHVFVAFAKATAPFVTGMGYEHPLENGFAFLNPYGLPYLPGSSIKGVLRASAEELMLDETIIAELFGDSAQDGKQGALNFWDVLPQGKLAIDIMTPHYGEYYQGKESPHDAGKPNPIVFLTMAPGASFAFYVQQIHAVDCDWQAELGKCFDHAFDWLGFGAKTAVGYGAMQWEEDAQEKFAETQAGVVEQARIEAMSPEQRKLAEIEQKRLGWDHNHGDFLSYVESCMATEEALFPKIHQKFCDLLEEYYQGIMANPDAVQGKKQKPKYKDRPKSLAKKLMALNP